MNIYSYEEAFGAWDQTSRQMRDAIDQWFKLYYGVTGQDNDGCQRIAYTVVSKLEKGWDSDVGEGEADLPYVKAVKELADGEGSQVFIVSAQIEEEIAQMDADEKAEFLTELGLGQSGLDRLIAASYELLGLQSFLTAGADECRAWTITNGTKAPQAAGKIHTDFERGFIRAEVVSYDDLTTLGSMNACKEKGLVRSEGKEYVMQDGDIVLFRFNV